MLAWIIGFFIGNSAANAINRRADYDRAVGRSNTRATNAQVFLITFGLFWLVVLGFVLYVAYLVFFGPPTGA